MTLSPESLEAFRSDAARRVQRVVALMAAVEAIGFTVMAWVVFRAAEQSLYWLLVYLAVVFPLGLGSMASVLRRSTRCLVGFLTVLAPRVRLVAPPSAQDPLLLLDNDLVLRFEPATSFRLFFSATGDPISPDIAEARRWIASVRLRRVGQVTGTRGDPSLRAGLDQISSRLGARWARLDVFDRTRVDASNPRSPNRDAQAAFFVRNAMGSGEAIVREVDSIRQLLVQAAAHSRTGPTRPVP